MSFFASFLIPVIFLFHFDANAGFSLRGHLGQSTHTSKDLNDFLSNSPNTLSGIRDLTHYGGDAVYVFESYQFLLGLRYEVLSKTKTSQGTFDSQFSTHTLKIQRNLTSLLLGYRFIDRQTYFGFISGYGITQSATFQLSSTSYTSSTGSHLFAALEFGARGMTMGFGTEVGFASSQVKDLVSGSTPLANSSGTALPFDTSGPYIKFVLSFYM